MWDFQSSQIMESLVRNLPPCAHAQSNWVTKIIRIMITYGLPAEQVLFLAFGLHFPWFYWQNLSKDIGTHRWFPPPLHAYHAVTRQPASASAQHSGKCTENVNSELSLRGEHLCRSHSLLLFGGSRYLFTNCVFKLSPVRDSWWVCGVSPQTRTAFLSGLLSCLPR